MVGSTTGVVSTTVGLVVSIVNGVTLRVEEIFQAGSVTVIVQFECVASVRALSVIVLFHVTAHVELELQSPPYTILPVSLELNV